MSQRPEILNLLDTYDTAWHRFCHSDERTVDTALYARQAAHAAIVRCFSDAPTRTRPADAGWLYECPNMKGVKDDRDMSGDNYKCDVCGKRTWLDYEEMR